MNIRPGTLRDLSHIARHRVEMFRGMGYTDPATLVELGQVAEAYLGAAIVNGSYRAWLAENDAGVVGGGGVVIVPWPGSPIELSPRRAWVLNMYTEPEFRRQGIARQLMETILDWCHAERLSAISLHASEEGRALYSGMGFVPTNEMRLTFGHRNSSQ